MGSSSYLGDMLRWLLSVEPNGLSVAPVSSRLPSRFNSHLLDSDTSPKMSDPPEWHSRFSGSISIRSDLELLCSDGKAIKVHSLKLALASPVLGALTDLMEDQIMTARRQRMTEGQGQAPMPQIKVHEDVMDGVFSGLSQA